MSGEKTRSGKSSQQVPRIVEPRLLPLTPAREELRERFGRWAEHGRPDGTEQDYPTWVHK